MKIRNTTAFAAAIIVIAVSIPACKMYYEAQKVDLNTQHANVTEGKRMTLLMCGPCHYDEGTKKFTGMRMTDVPRFVGKIYADNITGHNESGAGKYTAGELAYLIRTGIARDGRLMPYMQRPNLADEDLRNIIAFLKSGDALVAAHDTVPGKTRYSLFGRIGISAAGPLPWRDTIIERPVPGNPLDLGKYLVDNLSCYDCHSRSFMFINKMDPEKSKGYMGGGNKLKDKSGKTVRSSNLTPHNTGLGEWTDADFIRAMRDRVSRDNSIITEPMPSYAELTDMELTAIFLYLKSVPPINNRIAAD